MKSNFCKIPASKSAHDDKMTRMAGWRCEMRRMGRVDFPVFAKATPRPSGILNFGCWIFPSLCQLLTGLLVYAACLGEAAQQRRRKAFGNV